jgi:hypothetical protein
MLLHRISGCAIFGVMKNELASQLGKMAAGRPKNYSAEELALRKQRLALAKRWPKEKDAVFAAVDASNVRMSAMSRAERRALGDESRTLRGRRVSRDVAMEGLGDPSTWPAHAEAVNAEFRQKPSVTDSPLPAVSAPVAAQNAPNQALGVNQAVPVGVKKPRRDFFAGLRPAELEPPFEKVVREPFVE